MHIFVHSEWAPAGPNIRTAKKNFRPAKKEKKTRKQVRTDQLNIFFIARSADGCVVLWKKWYHEYFVVHQVASVTCWINKRREVPAARAVTSAVNHRATEAWLRIGGRGCGRPPQPGSSEDEMDCFLGCCWWRLLLLLPLRLYQYGKQVWENRQYCRFLKAALITVANTKTGSEKGVPVSWNSLLALISDSAINWLCRL